MQIVTDTVSGPHANPDLHPSDQVTPLAAGSPVGASRFPAGASARWLRHRLLLPQPFFAYQTQYSDANLSNFAFAPSFGLTRTRLIIHGQIHPLLQLRFEANIASSIDLLDMYALVPIARWLNIQVGQFRVPFSRQELVSERALPVRQQLALVRIRATGQHHIHPFVR